LTNESLLKIDVKFANKEVVRIFESKETHLSPQILVYTSVYKFVPLIMDAYETRVKICFELSQ